MEQLEKRFYNLDELSEITGINRKSKNLKRDVENTLTKWGYGYDWISHRGATIIHIPASPEERLREMLVRQFHVDIQVDMFSFSCFVTAFSDVEGFDNMPWGVRRDILYELTGKYYDERTLSNWARKLLEQEIMIKGTVGSFWKTEIEDNRKIRSSVPKEEVDSYYKRRTELLDELTEEYKHVHPKASDREARKAAWGAVYDYLWAEFGCCYYSCKTFHFTAWNKQGDLAEVYELTREISGKEGRYDQLRNKHVQSPEAATADGLEI